MPAKNCNDEAYRINKGRMVRVSNYSRDVLPDLITETGIEYDGREPGHAAIVCRTAKQMKEVGRQTRRSWRNYDFPLRGAVAATPALQLEPALAEVRGKFRVGGLRLTADRTGDCRMFTMALAEKCAESGCRVPVWPDDQGNCRRERPRGRRRHRDRRGGSRATAMSAALGKFMGRRCSNPSASTCRSIRSRAIR